MVQGSSVLRLGARGSLLSGRQSEWVARQLESLHPGLRVERVVIKTSGDRIQDRPLHEFGGKGLFTKELELALLDRRIDLAVHSFKDVPVTMPLVENAELVIAATPAREDARDVLVSLKGRSLEELAAGARVATSSLRRQAQVLERRPDVRVAPVRGNIDTRIGKLVSGEFEALILALAGVKRAGLWDERMMTALELEAMLPAAGQGALAVQCRGDAVETRRLLGALNDEETQRAVEAERRVVELLQGDCHSPIAALAQWEGEGLRLRAAVARRDGRPPLVFAEDRADGKNAAALPERVVEKLTAQGAEELLRDRSARP